MSESPLTRPTLLLAIRDPGNESAWRQFVEIYTPLIFRHCLKHGLQEADAADISQEVMKSVAQAIRRFDYDRARGSFRSWLLTVTRNKLHNFFASRARQPERAGDTVVEAQAAPEPTSQDLEEWEKEYRLRLFAFAADQIRPQFQEKTWQAFWRTAVAHEGVPEVAASLGLTPGAIYISRSRVLARLREFIESVTEEGKLIDALR